MAHEFFSREEELRAPVKEWLSRNGLDPVDELPVSGKIPDLVGMRNGRISVAVELKLSNWRRALYQATLYTLFAENSYIAMPENKKNLLQKNFRKIQKWRVRILIVSRDKNVYELVELPVSIESLGGTPQ